jgi:hypothetical protein
MSTKRVPITDVFSWQEPVINIITDSTRVGLSPLKGDRYLLSDGANINKICYYTGSIWIYLLPVEGWIIWNSNENIFYSFDGSNWSIFNVGQSLDGGFANSVFVSGQLFDGGNA